MLEARYPVSHTDSMHEEEESVYIPKSSLDRILLVMRSHFVRKEQFTSRLRVYSTQFTRRAAEDLPTMDLQCLA